MYINVLNFCSSILTDKGYKDAVLHHICCLKINFFNFLKSEIGWNVLI